MKDSTLIRTELWFLPMNIVMIATTIISIALDLIFISITMMYKTSSSVQIILNTIQEIFQSTLI